YYAASVSYVVAPRPAGPHLFPYTPLFRSQADGVGDQRALGHLGVMGGEQAVLEQRHGERLGQQRQRDGARQHQQEAQAQAPVERSEEHTSELQSRENLVCRLLLENKKKT